MRCICGVCFTRTLGLATYATVARRTRAEVAADLIHACAAILTRRRNAFVDVGLATDATVTNPACTKEAVELIDARCSVFTRSGRAFIDV